MKVLDQFETWLEAHLPEVAEDLLPGATDQELQDLSATLGIQLPDDFLRLYAWHNGQEDVSDCTGPWYGLSFLSIEKLKESYQMWKENAEASDPLSDSDGISSTPPGFVKRQHANVRWIPFAHDWSGNYLGIDLDPDEYGTSGQVINFGCDEYRKIAIAPSISAFVQWMMNELNNGNFKIDPDEGSFNTLRPESTHFLDALREMFPENEKTSASKT